jgi:GMP synthase-like glutamine amidotransferase
VPLTPTVVQWHEDAVVDLPPGAVLLASSTRYPNQAFRVGDRAWGLQFHIETPPDMVRRWGRDYGSAVVAAGLDPVALAERAVGELDEVEACWRPVVERFAAVAAGRGRVRLPLLGG